MLDELVLVARQSHFAVGDLFHVCRKELDLRRRAEKALERAAELDLEALDTTAIRRDLDVLDDADLVAVAIDDRASLLDMWWPRWAGFRDRPEVRVGRDAPGDAARRRDPSDGREVVVLRDESLEPVELVPRQPQRDHVTVLARALNVAERHDDVVADEERRRVHDD